MPEPSGGSTQDFDDLTHNEYLSGHKAFSFIRLAAHSTFCAASSESRSLATAPLRAAPKTVRMPRNGVRIGPGLCPDRPGLLSGCRRNPVRQTPERCPTWAGILSGSNRNRCPNAAGIRSCRLCPNEGPHHAPNGETGASDVRPLVPRSSGTDPGLSRAQLSQPGCPCEPDGPRRGGTRWWGPRA